MRYIQLTVDQQIIFLVTLDKLSLSQQEEILKMVWEKMQYFSMNSSPGTPIELKSEYFTFHGRTLLKGEK